MFRSQRGNSSHVLFAVLIIAALATTASAVQRTVLTEVWTIDT